MTNRERSVLALVAAGMQTQEIAGQLMVSPGTVKAAIASLLRKLGVRNRVEAVSAAFRLGIADLDGDVLERSHSLDRDADSFPSEAIDGRPDQHVDVLLEVAESMTSADGSRRALNRLAALALRATGADRCAILVRDHSGRRQLVPAAGASRVGDPRELSTLFRDMEPIDVDGEPSRESLWGSAHAILLDDAQSSPLIPGIWRRVWGIRSLAFTTLRAAGEAYGVLAVSYDEEPHHFTPAEGRLLEAIGIAAGVALRSARLVERLQQSVAVERRLAECAAAMRSGRSLGEVLDLVADRFVSLLPGASCSINVLSEDGNGFSRVAASISQPGPMKTRLDELPREDVQRIREIWGTDPRFPIVIPDLRARPGWEGIVPPDIRTAMLLPLSEDSGVHGFIAVGRDGEPFTTEDVAIAVAFADRVGFAVTQARLTETLQVRLKLLEALYRLSDAVVRTSDLKAALAALNRDVCAEVGVECVRLTFGEAALARDFRLPAPTDQESDLIKAWRSGSQPTAPAGADELPLPIPINGRPAGVLWVAADEFDAGRLELARAVAAGLGEVALKSKLRRTAENRAHQLAVAAERERMARDLHDLVGQTFYGMGLKLQDLLHEVDDGALVERLESLRELAALGVADVRSAIHALSALHVRALGFLPSLRALTRQFTLATGATAELRVVGKLPALPEEVEGALYRMVHEALVNVDRHARATGVVVSCRGDPGGVELVVRDDGVGLDQRQVRDWRSSARFGLRAMAKSVEEVGGRFEVAAAHPRGLIIRAVVSPRARLLS